MVSVSRSTGVIRVGSRKSQLALVQTHWVVEQIQKVYPDRAFELHTMSTQGDKILDVALAKIGDKGLFTKELEVGLLDRNIDFVVHSLKDLPTQLPEGLTLGAISERKDPSDALVVHEKFQAYQMATLPPGTVIGTSSLRRLAQLRYHFPHLTFKDIRGNLNTRLSKLDARDYDAIILAVAGIERLAMEKRIHQILPPEISLHAVGQGALGIECRTEDSRILEIIRSINHSPTSCRCIAERAFLRALEGGCQVPIGVNSILEHDQLKLVGLVASLDGQTLIKNEVSGSVAEPVRLGEDLAAHLREQGAQEILDAIDLVRHGFA